MRKDYGRSMRTSALYEQMSKVTDLRVVDIKFIEGLKP